VNLGDGTSSVIPIYCLVRAGNACADPSPRRADWTRRIDPTTGAQISGNGIGLGRAVTQRAANWNPDEQSAHAGTAEAVICSP
jgi:hypothetical protein